jgi:hypothetical protein
MSAAATSVLPPPVIRTGITGNWTRSRPVYMTKLAAALEYAQDIIFGAILDSTVGMGKHAAKISWTYFEKLTKTKRRCCEQAIAALLGKDEDNPDTYKAPIIRSRKVSGGYEYSIVVRPEGDKTGIRKCGACGKAGEVDLDRDFIPVVHSLYRLLPMVCDQGMYLIIKAIYAKTVGWDKEIIVTPYDMTIDDLCHVTGRKRSETIKDLKKVQAEGFVSSETRGGRTYYWVNPQNFANGQARPVRVLNRQHNKERKGESDTTPKVSQPIDNKQSVRPLECVTKDWGVCRQCHEYAPMEPVSEQDSVKKPLSSASRVEWASRGAPANQPLASWPSFKLPDWKKEA